MVCKARHVSSAALRLIAGGALLCLVSLVGPSSTLAASPTALGTVGQAAEGAVSHVVQGSGTAGSEVVNHVVAPASQVTTPASNQVATPTTTPVQQPLQAVQQPVQAIQQPVQAIQQPVQGQRSAVTPILAPAEAVTGRVASALAKVAAPAGPTLGRVANLAGAAVASPPAVTQVVDSALGGIAKAGGSALAKVAAPVEATVGSVTGTVAHSLAGASGALSQTSPPSVAGLPVPVLPHLPVVGSQTPVSTPGLPVQIPGGGNRPPGSGGPGSSSPTAPGGSSPLPTAPVSGNHGETASSPPDNGAAAGSTGLATSSTGLAANGTTSTAGGTSGTNSTEPASEPSTAAPHRLSPSGKTQTVLAPGAFSKVLTSAALSASTFFGAVAATAAARGVDAGHGGLVVPGAPLPLPAPLPATGGSPTGAGGFPGSGFIIFLTLAGLLMWGAPRATRRMRLASESLCPAPFVLVPDRPG
jgi:hypothetical protein